MADYSKLVQETENIELRSIASCALDELLLVKRAISFFETLRRISVCLRHGVSRSAPGMMDTQQLSLYQLTSALASVDPKACSDPVKFFLANASAIRSIIFTIIIFLLTKQLYTDLIILLLLII